MGDWSNYNFRHDENHDLVPTMYYSPLKKDVLRSHMDYMNYYLNERLGVWNGYATRYSDMIFSPLAKLVKDMYNVTNHIRDTLDNPKSTDLAVQKKGQKLANLYYDIWQRKEERIGQILRTHSGFSFDARLEICDLNANRVEETGRYTLPDQYPGGSDPHAEFMNEFRMNHIFRHPDFSTFEQLFRPNADEKLRYNTELYNEDCDANVPDSSVRPFAELTAPPVRSGERRLSRNHSVESLVETEDEDEWNEYVTLDMVFPEPPKQRNAITDTGDKRPFWRFRRF